MHNQLRGHTGFYCSGVIIIRRTIIRTILTPLITIITITIAIIILLLLLLIVTVIIIILIDTRVQTSLV